MFLESAIRVSPGKWPKPLHPEGDDSCFDFSARCSRGVQEVPQGLATFLRDRIGVSNKEMDDLQRAQVVAKDLPSEREGVAVFDQHAHSSVEFRSPLYFH